MSFNSSFKSCLNNWREKTRILKVRNIHLEKKKEEDDAWLALMAKAKRNIWLCLNYTFLFFCWKRVWSYQRMPPVATIKDCEDEWPLTVTYTQCTHKRYCILYDLITSLYVFETTRFGAKRFFSSSRGTAPSRTQWQSDDGSIKSTNRAWNVTDQTKCHCTSTSHIYLFSTFLPASAFIYCFVSVFYDCGGIADTRTATWLKKMGGKNRRTFEQSDVFLSAFTFHESYLYSFTRVVSHNSGPFFFDLKKCR